MATSQTHRWVNIGRLLPQNWTGKYGVVPGVGTDIDLDWQFIFGIPHSSNLSLLHDLNKKQSKSVVAKRTII
jgi:hypothetical protein